MAKITIELDTTNKTLSVKKDGNELLDIKSAFFDFYKYDDDAWSAYFESTKMDQDGVFTKEGAVVDYFESEKSESKEMRPIHSLQTRVSDHEKVEVLAKVIKNMLNKNEQ